MLICIYSEGVLKNNFSVFYDSILAVANRLQP